MVAARDYRESNYIHLVCLWICHKKWQQVSSPYIQHIFYVFLCQSTICINSSELWDLSGHNSEIHLLDFVTGFWCSLPMHLHEASLWHLPQHFQVHSELGRRRSAFTEKCHPAFLWDASDHRGYPLAGDLLGVERLPSLHVQVLLPSTGWDTATDQLYLQEPRGVMTIRSRSLVKKAVC